MCGVVDSNTNGNYALQRISLVTAVTKEDIFKLFVSPRDRRRNAAGSINKVTDLEEVEVPFLGAVSSSEANFWNASVNVDGHETHSKLDTGAAASIVSDKEPWLKDHQLTKSQLISVRGPGGTIPSVVGTFRATLTV